MSYSPYEFMGIHMCVCAHAHAFNYIVIERGMYVCMREDGKKNNICRFLLFHVKLFLL